MTATITPSPIRTVVARPSAAVRRIAITAATCLAGLVVVQLALAAGAPLGRAAWGGEHTTLPAGLRVATVVPIAIYALGAAVVLRRAGLGVRWISAGFARRGTWVFAVVLLLSALLNAASPSDWERFVMAPFALVLGLLIFVVARSPARPPKEVAQQR